MEIKNNNNKNKVTSILTLEGYYKDKGSVRFKLTQKKG